LPRHCVPRNDQLHTFSKVSQYPFESLNENIKTLLIAV